MTTLDETIDYLQGEWVSAKDGYEAGNSFSDWLALKLSENRAALERARALVQKWRDRGKAPHLYSENERVTSIVAADELTVALDGDTAPAE